MAYTSKIRNGVVAIPNAADDPANGVEIKLDSIGGTEEQDIDNELTSTTTTFTAAHTGYYMFACIEGMSQVDTNSYWQTFGYVNGSKHVSFFIRTQGKISGEDALMGNACFVFELTKGDTVEIYGVFGTGATTDTYTSGGRYNGFRMVYLGS